MKLTRGEPIIFERHDGSAIVAPPITRGQMEEALAIDAEAENAEDRLPDGDRRGRQVAVFLRDAKWCRLRRNQVVKELGPIADVLVQLTPEEEILIIHAFMAQHHGYSVKTATDYQRARLEIKKKGLLRNQRPRS